jgi:protein subunit release factor B
MIIRASIDREGLQRTVGSHRQGETTLKKTLLFSVTMKDLEMQTFSVGGHGGSGKDTSNSGVRLTHRASGAVGEGRENRTNTLNRQSAFKKLINTQEFKRWHKAECARRMGKKVEETPEEIMARVDEMIRVGLQNGDIAFNEDGELISK